MGKIKDSHRTVTEKLQLRQKRLSWLIALIIVIVLFLIVRYMYGVLDYLPALSTIVLMTIIAALSAATYMISRATTNKALSVMEDYSRKITALLATTRDIQEIGYSDILLDHILDISIEMTQADGGSLILIEGDSLTFKTVRGAIADKLAGTCIPRAEGVVGWCVGNRSTVRINDVRKDQRFFKGVDELTGYETRSILCVPLACGENVLGAIELTHDEPDSFRFDDEEIMRHFADQAALSFERARQHENENNYKIHLTSILVEAIERLSKKRGHAKRVARYTLILANTLGMGDRQKERLYRASMLLDVGFLKIDTAEVTSPDQYRAHAKLAYEMLLPIAFYADIVQFILHHHERYDGSGYPVGLSGEAIPMEARILAIAEAFDAMISKASYKNVDKVIGREFKPHIVDYREAREELARNAGTQFDPKLVQAFLDSITEDDVAY